MDKKYVYPYSLLEAKRNGELEQYRESFRENVRCANAIKEAINQNFDGMHLNHDVAKPVITEFGYDRVNFVLANTLQQLEHDGKHKVYSVMADFQGITRSGQMAFSSMKTKRTLEIMNLWLQATLPSLMVSLTLFARNMTV